MTTVFGETVLDLEVETSHSNLVSAAFNLNNGDPKRQLKVYIITAINFYHSVRSQLILG